MNKKKIISIISMVLSISISCYNIYWPFNEKIWFISAIIFIISYISYHRIWYENELPDEIVATKFYTWRKCKKCFIVRPLSRVYCSCEND